MSLPSTVRVETVVLESRASSGIARTGFNKSFAA
jgi:hypothetical protein